MTKLLYINTSIRLAFILNGLLKLLKVNMAFSLNGVVYSVYLKIGLHIK